MKLCSYGGCGRIVTREEGRCPEHARAEGSGETRKLQALRLSDAALAAHPT